VGNRVAHLEGRFSTATNGVVRDFVPRLQLLSASCVGGTAEVAEHVGPEPFVFFQNCTLPRQISFRLRLIDSAAPA